MKPFVLLPVISIFVMLLIHINSLSNRIDYLELYNDVHIERMTHISECLTTNQEAILILRSLHK